MPSGAEDDIGWPVASCA